MIASSSSATIDLKRPSQQWPVTLSARLIALAIFYLSSLWKKERLDRSSRHFAISSGSATAVSISSEPERPEPVGIVPRTCARNA